MKPLSSHDGNTDAHTHAHKHGVINPELFFHGESTLCRQVVLTRLVATALIQIVIYRVTGNISLLADTIHNFGDAATANPLIGLLITVLILQIVWEAGKPLILRMLDGVEPEIVDEILQVVGSI